MRMFKLKNVPEELQSAISEKGYDKLTTVQNLVLDPSNVGKDLLVSSQTGSGKTPVSYTHLTLPTIYSV